MSLPPSPAKAAKCAASASASRPAEAIVGAEHQRHGDVFQHRQIAERPRNLIGAADAEPRDRVAAQAAQALPGEHDVAADRLEDLGQAVEQRRLAGAVRADQAEDLALADLQVDTVDGDVAAEGHGEIARGEKDPRAVGVDALAAAIAEATGMTAAIAGCDALMMLVAERRQQGNALYPVARATARRACSGRSAGWRGR